MIGLVHDKALNAHGGQVDEGRAVTLMSTDVAVLEGAALLFHDAWALLLEGSIGIALLVWQVGQLWPLPFIIVFCKPSLSQINPITGSERRKTKLTPRRSENKSARE